ncbi:MAG: phosphoribosylformylglycinamidine synthase subunit PurQ [Actinomycetota bacterium]
MTARVGVITFPGSNDDRDAARAVRLLGGEPVRVWHNDADLSDVDAVILPGGFSYGDYLRTGAIAQFSPVLGAVRELAGAGRPVIGICNGFQILCEAGLLPGALIRNRSLKFVCRWVRVRVESASSALTEGLEEGRVLEIPVKHGEGQFVAAGEELERIEGEGLVTFRYCAPDGSVDDVHNVNGSSGAIAGLRNERGNVVGLMPHPEHAVDPDVGPTGGRPLIESLLEQAGARVLS